METFERIEIKYILNQNQFLELKKILPSFFYYGPYGIYNISNLYYDTADFSLIKKSIDKPVFKEKVRIRTYNNFSNKEVFFEMKRKYKGIVYKRRIPIDYKDINNLENYLYCQIGKELDYTINFHNLVPKVFLNYDREEYISKDDETFRLTFDSNIIARDYDLALNIGNYGDKILEDKIVMEIKISKNLPLWFVKELSFLKIYPSSFSKYGEFYKNKFYQKEEFL